MTIQGFLLDLEGVLYQGSEPIAGASEAISSLMASGMTIRYLTNTTTQPRRVIIEKLGKMGFDVTAEHVFTPAIAAVLLLRQRKLARLHLAAAPELAEDFVGFKLVDRDADAIVLGDLYKGFDWDRLNVLFQMMRQGATLIALHKNRYSRRSDEIALDLGPFVAALDYANGTTAEVVGKPSELFFKLALDDMGLRTCGVVMVGDDIEADIGGAQSSGIKAIQVRTGKFTENDLNYPIQPDKRISSVAELTSLDLS